MDHDPSTKRNEPADVIAFTAPGKIAPGHDYFVRRDGLVFAGTHLLVDLYGAENLNDIDHISAMLEDAVVAVGATLLRLDLHRFDENGGITGVAVLAESHMSIHTWPEVNYAALDVFVCGDCDAYKAVPVFKEALQPDNLQVTEHKRGMVI
jgi:S-adenosylmethionine decarboxylase